MSASWLKTVGLRTVIACSLASLPAVGSWGADQNDPQARGRAMLYKAEQLAKQGRVNEAEELARSAKKLLAAPDTQESARQMIRQFEEDDDRLKQLETQSRGRQELQRWIAAARQREDSQRKLDPREHKGPHGDQSPMQEATRRLQHLRQAAEHLQAAGMPEMAKEAIHRAEEIERHVRDEQERRARTERESVQDHRDRALDELRQELKEIRQELRALRERL